MKIKYQILDTLRRRKLWPIKEDIKETGRVRYDERENAQIINSITSLCEQVAGNGDARR